MNIYYATKNKSKVQSLRRDLKEYDIKVIQIPLDLYEPRSYDVVEIANKKIISAYDKIKKPTVVLDAGFYIYSIKGFPRAFVNFALETIGIEGILDLVKNKERKCEFTECLSYLDSSLENPLFFVSKVKGEIAYEPKGKMKKHLWSELGRIFIPDGSQKTLAELTYNEYLEWRKITREKESAGKLLGDWLLGHRLADNRK